MIILLSPAKNLNFDPVADAPPATKPALLAHTAELAETTRALTKANIRSLMGVSEKLAALNHERFQGFRTRGRIEGAKAAALAFNGDVYLGLDAGSLTPDDLAFAQDRVRILSGLYGVLRPLDAIQPYRLEMGSRLRTERGATLYDFWGDLIAREINKASKHSADRTIVNLASREYFTAVDPTCLKGRVVTPVFKEEKDGALRQLQFFAKRARGLMARWAIVHRIDDAEALKEFDTDGYRYRPDLSSENEWLFSRPQPPLKSK